jgi:RimJ/RimL family protein N-acetyltransferase
VGAAERFRWLYLDEQRQVPRQRAIIATADGDEAVGWVVRYGHEEDRFPDAWKVGINIGEDACLDRGMGSEAFGLWVDYLFAQSKVHRIGFATYAFNPRMIAVGRKLGFVHEGTDREVIRWQRRWVDRLHFGVLRREWPQM